MVTLMVTGWVPNALAALIACLLMGATRCITLNSAYKSIQWPSLILIVGMMPFSTALQKTGGVELAAQGLLHLFGQAEPRLLLAALFVAHRDHRPLRLEYRYRRAHGADRIDRRAGSWRVAVSIHDDHRARRVGSLHDAGLIAGEYARARAGAISLRRFRAHWRSIHVHCFAHHGSPRAVAAAAAAVSTNSGTRQLPNPKFAGTTRNGYFPDALVEMDAHFSSGLF